MKRIRKNLGNLTKQLLGFGELGEVLVKRRRKFKEISESIWWFCSAGFNPVQFTFMISLFHVHIQNRRRRDKVSLRMWTTMLVFRKSDFETWVTFSFQEWRKHLLPEDSFKLQQLELALRAFSFFYSSSSSSFSEHLVYLYVALSNFLTLWSEPPLGNQWLVTCTMRASLENMRNSKSLQATFVLFLTAFLIFHQSVIVNRNGTRGNYCVKFIGNWGPSGQLQMLWISLSYDLRQGKYCQSLYKKNLSAQQKYRSFRSLLVYRIVLMISTGRTTKLKI